jgi:tetratricopeptide (TPR) repeat protein
VFKVGTALIVELFTELPHPGPDDDPTQWKIRMQAAHEGFKKRVQARYSEGTLLRLLQHFSDPTTRRAALLALGLLGSMSVNKHLAGCLHDDDPEVRRSAVNALWSLWFRGEGPGLTKELQRLLRQKDPAKALAGFDNLLQRAPQYAEAYNQRAILFFRLRQYDRSIADCEKALELNPFHFGAQAGIGQSLLQLRRPRAALRAFRNALKIHPHLEDVAETVRSLEQSIEGDGRHDDKK